MEVHFFLGGTPFGGILQREFNRKSEDHVGKGGCLEKRETHVGMGQSMGTPRCDFPLGPDKTLKGDKNFKGFGIFL